MKTDKRNGMNLKEAAEILGVRKGQAIMMAEAGWLEFINNGENGKEKTVTYDSVFTLKRKGNVQDALASAKEFQAKRSEAPSPAPAPVTPAPASIPKADPAEVVQLIKSVGQLVAGVSQLISETRQLKGILCSKFKLGANAQQEFAL